MMEGRRGSPEAQQFLQLIQNIAHPRQAQSPHQGDDRWGDNRFSTFLLGQQEDKSLYFLFCFFVCASADLKDQPAAL